VVQRPRWTVPLELPRRSRRKADAGDAEIRRRVADVLAAAIGAFETSSRDGFLTAAADWSLRLEDQATRQSAQAADRFRRCLQTVPRDEDLAALDDLAAKLTGFLTALGARDSCPGEDTADRYLARGIITPAGSARADGCVVCQQMETVLTDYLRRHQFLLATREHDQARHTLDGGFCPLHTWQYAAIASPLDISADYAKLAATVADALESIARHAATGPDQARRVAALVPQAGTCPLCTALAERERSAITETITGGPGAATATLCLRHLAPALAAGPAPETGGRCSVSSPLLSAGMPTTCAPTRSNGKSGTAGLSPMRNQAPISTRSACSPDCLPSPSRSSGVTTPGRDRDSRSARCHVGCLALALN
jgi:hypothetical protein